MGFEPQTSEKPLVNVHKRTTKVNIFMAVGVVLFLLVGVGIIIWAIRRENQGEPVRTENIDYHATATMTHAKAAPDVTAWIAPL